MPEMHFTVEWPDGERQRCYSPSYIVEEYVAAGASYDADEFVRRMGVALEIASERVRARYGYACSSALDQLAALREKLASLSPETRAGQVRVLELEKHPPRDARKQPAPKEEG